MVVFLLVVFSLLRSSCWRLQLLSAITGMASVSTRGDVTANPIEYFTHATGDWTLRFLVYTLWP